MAEIVVFGGDGYIGWPLSVELALEHPGKTVLVVDNFLTRRNSDKVGGQPLIPIRSMPERIAAFREVYGQNNIRFREIDCSDPEAMTALFQEITPEVVYHLAHQRAAPYSMLSLQKCIETISNNEIGFLNLIWSLKEYCPDCHLVKLGSFGAYAKPGLDIPEGNAYITINGKTSAVPAPFPRASDDFYHITKINDGNFAGLACRKWGLRITDVMQSTVFGAMTDKTAKDERLHTRFDYDEILGTVVNRFVTQAIAGLPLTVYGCGRQTSGIMVIDDCIKVLVNLASDAGEPGQHRIINNSPRYYSINELADLVCAEAAGLGIKAEVCHSYNPRFEEGTAYDYTVETKYIDSLMTPTPLSKAIGESMELLMGYKDKIDVKSIIPTHNWFGNVASVDEPQSIAAE